MLSSSVRRCPSGCHLRRGTAPTVHLGRRGSTLVDALTRITEGGTVIDPTIVSRVIGRRRGGPGTRDPSNREVEVLALLAEGLSNRAIAERLVINERTIETHINQIFVKLGLETSPETHRRVLAVLTFLRSASPT